MNVTAQVLQAFKAGLDDHDAKNPGHTANGIGMAWFDMERLGFDEGETILPGITIQADGGTTGTFRVLCDGTHDHDHNEEEAEQQEPVKAVSDPNPSRMDPVFA